MAQITVSQTCKKSNEYMWINILVKIWYDVNLDLKYGDKTYVKITKVLIKSDKFV